MTRLVEKASRNSALAMCLTFQQVRRQIPYHSHTKVVTQRHHTPKCSAEVTKEVLQSRLSAKVGTIKQTCHRTGRRMFVEDWTEGKRQAGKLYLNKWLGKYVHHWNLFWALMYRRFNWLRVEVNGWVGRWELRQTYCRCKFYFLNARTEGKRWALFKQVNGRCTCR